MLCICIHTYIRIHIYSYQLTDIHNLGCTQRLLASFVLGCNASSILKIQSMTIHTSMYMYVCIYIYVYIYSYVLTHIHAGGDEWPHLL